MQPNEQQTIFSLGFSPCPNDTFIFDAMVHGKVDTEGLSFTTFIADVEVLNQKAFGGEPDISKLSFHAYTYLTEAYVLLDSGSAIGNNCGPLLISADPKIQKTDDLIIAIPGRYTTANLLLSLYAPKTKNRVEMLFSDIEDAVQKGKVDAGLIIHENRFTYREKGLYKIIDMGEYWEELTQTPIPLGGIVAKRTLPPETLNKINRILRRSVEYALANPHSGINFIREHAQEMSEDVIYKHINLYVNHFSVDLGEKGRRAVKLLFLHAQRQGLMPVIKQQLFMS